ncbi:MAG: respiratory nitrate reductase subunit gamma [Gammaproteobacteria bacterium]|nr:respiratory nitrate reductase subunit gamma [Gammaproteobacteria bacterium]
MMFLTVVYAILFYVATAILVVGIGYRIYTYAKVPAPLKIPTTPAPVTRSGVVYRMLKEVTVFESLFKSNKWIWLFGWLFHVSLFLVLARHLRYFTDPVWGWVAFIQPFGKYAAFGMIAGLAGLWARRFLVDRVRYITSPSDHLMLALLVLIGLTGLGMKYVVHTDIVSLKLFFLGLMRFDINPLPIDFFLLIHLLLIVTLMIVFPFSKLLHAPGVFFSPSRNQVDNPREKRHIAKWALQYENKKPS